MFKKKSVYGSQKTNGGFKNQKSIKVNLYDLEKKEIVIVSLENMNSLLNNKNFVIYNELEHVINIEEVAKEVTVKKTRAKKGE